MDLSSLPICSNHHNAISVWFAIGSTAGCVIHCAMMGVTFLSGCCGLHRAATGMMGTLTRHAVPAFFCLTSLTMTTIPGVLT